MDSTKKPAKWIGFDMDECLGSLILLYPFLSGVKKINAEDARLSLHYMQQVLIDSELEENTWIIRPAMIDALKYVYQAYNKGLIHGAFIYSNNNSAEIVKFAQYLCDGIIWRLFDLKDTPMIFKMGLHFCDGIRAHNNLIKSFDEIQSCLAKFNLPIMNSVDDLLFFDDMQHVLANEIPHYVQVSPYRNITPIYRLIELFDGIESVIGTDLWNKIISNAIRFNSEYVSDNSPKKPQLKSIIADDKYIIKSAFIRFLQKSNYFSVGGYDKYAIVSYSINITPPYIYGVI